MFRAFFLAALAACVPACALFDDHCAGDTLAASATPPLAGAALDRWNESVCTTAEDDMCREAMPHGNALELCQHTTTVLTTSRGSTYALRCHYYSSDKSCHSTHSEHHKTPEIPLPPPGH